VNPGQLALQTARFVFNPVWWIYAFLILPTLIVVPMSLTGDKVLDFPPRSWSLDLYREFFGLSGSRIWLDSTFLSFRVAVVTTILAVLVGVPAAYGLVRGTYPGRTLVTIFLLSPLFVPVVVLALGLYMYFAPLRLTGSEFSLILGHVLVVTPFVILSCMGGMRRIDVNLELAAAVMGSGRFRVMYTVVVPLLAPSIVAGALFAFLMSFDEVVISYFLSATGSMTLPVRMYSSIEWEISPVLAAASSILTATSIVICLLASHFRKGPEPS
jgi:putative spermidine/putrescine transport system permease protein